MSAQAIEALASGGGRVFAPDVLKPKKKLKPAQLTFETKKRAGGVRGVRQGWPKSKPLPGSKPNAPLPFMLVPTPTP
jgi:hypothetical protein